MYTNHFSFKPGQAIRRLAALLLVLACVMSFSTPLLAAESSVLFNVSCSPCKGNLSSYAFPTGIITLDQGRTYYINLAATSDFEFDRYDVYIKAPGQTYYTLVESYDPSGYFRWYYFDYRFTSSGTYSIIPVITATNGAQASAQVEIYVNECSTYSDTSSYYYNGSYYNVVPNLRSEYCINQNNYSRFKNSYGYNRGCTATAMCIAYSIYHDTFLSPNDVAWYSWGTPWEYCSFYSNQYRSFSNYSEKSALQAAYNCVSNGKPIIVGVTGSNGDHVVVVVGIRDGADYSNLTLSDLLIVDPNGGKISTLSKYTGIDNTWSLRVPD